MRSARPAADARINELKEIDDYPENKGLFSKTKRISLISKQEDSDRIVSWDETRALLDGKDAGEVMWVDFQGIDVDEMKQIEKYFKLHPLTVEDCLSPDTREKFEVFDGYFFVVVNEIHYIEYSNVLNNVNVYIIVFPDMILSFHPAPIQSAHEVIHKLSFEQHARIPSSDWLLYALIDGIVDIYVTLVDQVVRESESLDGLVLLLSGLDQTELLERIGYANRHAGHLKSGLWSKKEILTSLQAFEKVSKHVNIYLQNVVDHVVRSNQKLKLSREALRSLNSVYLAKVSIELAVASNEMNVVMRRLAALSAIFLPLTLISGIFGMNVQVPGMVDMPGTPSGFGWFIGIMLFMVGLGGLIGLFFKWKRWL